MSETSGTLIVGAGQAGSELASTLRQLGYTARIVLIGDEEIPPYRRPPLSKAYLAGEVTRQSLIIKPQAAYEKAGIECRFGIGAESIDRAGKTLRLYNGSELKYDKLALTTGGRARKLSIAGADKPNVHYVRTIADIDALKVQFNENRRVVIIGGGYIGLEQLRPRSRRVSASPSSKRCRACWRV